MELIVDGEAVEDVEVAVLVVVGVKGEAEDAAFAFGAKGGAFVVEIVLEGKESGFGHGVQIHDLDAEIAFDDEETVGDAWRRCDINWTGESQ